MPKRIPDSLETSAVSSRDSLGLVLRVQDEDKEPTASFAELQPQEEACLSSSGACLPNRQPETRPSQDPFKTVPHVGLCEEPDSPALGMTMYHQPQLCSQAGSPKQHHDHQEEKPPLLRFRSKGDALWKNCRVN
jgi:hypothetical protein